MPALPRRGPDLSGDRSQDPLGPLLDLPGVRDSVEAARTACEELRWHEAFRRRWREVRAEADVRAARASAAVDGARVPVGLLRGVATGTAAAAPGSAGVAGSVGGRTDARPGDAGRSEGGDPAADLRLATGALRATVLAAGWRPDLGGRAEPVLPPFAQIVARLHTAAGAGWLPDGDLGRLRGDRPPQDLRGLGPALTGDALAARLALLGRTVETSAAPALVVAAVAHAELLALRPFVAGNGVVARAVFRLLLAGRGLDPTGAVVPEAGWAAAPNPYLAAAAGFATGTPEGVAGWLRTCAQGVRDGAAAGREVADAVLAGRLG